MNRKVAKLLRGFCKVTDQSYRTMKKNYYTLSPEDRRDSKIKLARFWKENSDILDHKKYYDLKKKLTKPGDHITPEMEAAIERKRLANLTNSQ